MEIQLHVEQWKQKILFMVVSTQHTRPWLKIIFCKTKHHQWHPLWRLKICCSLLSCIAHVCMCIQTRETRPCALSVCAYKQLKCKNGDLSGCKCFCFFGRNSSVEVYSTKQLWTPARCTWQSVCIFVAHCWTLFSSFSAQYNLQHWQIQHHPV